MYCKIVRKSGGIVRTFSYKVKPSIYAGYSLVYLIDIVYCNSVRDFEKLSPREACAYLDLRGASVEPDFPKSL
jgi:hypothetical protein